MTAVMPDAAPIPGRTPPAAARAGVSARPRRPIRRPGAVRASTPPAAGGTRRTTSTAAVAPATRTSRAPWVRMRTRTFLMLIAALLSVTLVAILILNTVLAKGSFARYELVTRNSQLGVVEQDLAQQVASLESPFELEKRARELGMVPASNPVYIDLATGQVLGDAAVAAQPDFTQAAASTEYIDITDGTGPVAGTATKPTDGNGSATGAPAAVPGGETPLGLRDGGVGQ